MSDGMMRNAIQQLETRRMPQASPIESFIPTEQYRSIYPLLEVWGKDGDNQVSQDKTKYIFDRLSENKSSPPAHTLISLLTELGAVNFGESKLDKVYRFFHLHKEACKIKNYFERLVEERTPHSLLAAKKIAKYHKVLTKEIASARSKGVR